MWHNYNESKLLDIPVNIRQEIFGVLSLTKRISSRGKFRVQVLSQQNGRQFADESLPMSSLGILANVRNVLLYCDDYPVIFARTVLPVKYIKNNFNQLTSLGNKSLGAVLHFSKQIKIESTEIGNLITNDNLSAELIKYNLVPEDLWARRTIYKNQSLKIMVNEVFLSQYWQVVA